MNRHVVVVGGGVFGATAALELGRRGWRVTLIDPEPLPAPRASSTDVSKVIRMDYGSDRFYHELGEAAMEGWDRWNAEWPEPLYHEHGFLILTTSRMTPGDFAAESHRVLLERGHQPTRLETGVDAPGLSRFAPDSWEDGYFNPRGGWAESGAVVERLLTLAEARGVVIERAAFGHLISEGSRISGVALVGGQVIAADAVVVAAGAWTPRLLPWLSDRLWSVAQPVVHVQVDHPARFSGRAFGPWAYDIANTGWYGFPSLANGQLKIGHHGRGTRRDPDDRGIVDHEHDQRVRAFLRHALPELADAPIVFRRVCMYCDSFDGDLFIGRDPDREGLVVASGGSGHGFKFAPVLGAAIADSVEEGSSRWASRFGWRSLGDLATEEARYGDPVSPGA